MPELRFVGFRLGFANPRFELRQLMGVIAGEIFRIWRILTGIEPSQRKSDFLPSRALRHVINNSYTAQHFTRIPQTLSR